MNNLLTTDEYNDLGIHAQADYINNIAHEVNGCDWIDYDFERNCYYDLDDYAEMGDKCDPIEDLFDYILDQIDFGTVKREQVFKD